MQRQWEEAIERVYIATHWHCPLEARQSLSCTHSDRFCLPLGTPQMTRPSCCMPRKCSSGDARLAKYQHAGHGETVQMLCDSRIAGNLPPDVPTMDSLPTLPRLRRSNSVRPTTPTFLSDLEAPPPTNPVVYSPVPTWRAISIDMRRAADVSEPQSCG